MDNNNQKKKNKYYYKYHNNHNWYNNKNNKKFYYYKKNKKNKHDNVVQENNNQINENDNILINNSYEQKELDLNTQTNYQGQKEEQVVKQEDNYQELNIKPLKKEEVEFTSKKGIFKYALGFFLLVIMLFGVTYSFFTYRKEDSRQGDIASGEVYVTLVEQSVSMTLNRMYPRTATEARSRDDNYIDFTVKAKNTSETKSIYYNININNGEDVSGKTRINPQYLIVDLEEKVGNEYTYVKNAVPLSSFSFQNEVKPNTNSEITKEYRLRIWVSDAILISDTEANATYTQSQFNNLYANLNITVDSNDGTPTKTGTDKVREAITAKINATTNSCNPVFIDDNGTANDESDDITYFSGTNDCIDMNYVWYSGKLWRITSIYPDGTMKLVTEDNITSIFWGSDVEYDGSWVYQWLNEDFYDTLVNPNNIIDSTSTWNYSEDGNTTPVRPETIATQKTKIAPVGLLNAYEYYNSYRCIGSVACTGTSYSTGYLNIGYYWWLITPYSASNVRIVYYNGTLYNNSPSGIAGGIRPSIVIKSGLEFTGDGSKSSPYKIVGDKEDPINDTTLLSSRSIGEYVNFDNNVYRIVDTNGGITKLTRVDYLRNNSKVISKNFASTAYFGESTNTQSDDYWDYYLNNTWYNDITSTYKNMMIDGTYYLGFYPNNTNYKATICKDANLNSVTVTNCTKYTSSDANKIYTGKVGLPRAGEMFSSQLGKGNTSSYNMWLITPNSNSHVRSVSIEGVLSYDKSDSINRAIRPSITLKSGIKITSGTGYVGGNTNSPFEISE